MFETGAGGPGRAPGKLAAAADGMEQRAGRPGWRGVAGVGLLAAAMLAAGATVGAQQAAVGRGVSGGIDRGIAATLAQTRAFDNHAHPPLPMDAGDRDFDALPVDAMEPETDPVAWRPDFAGLPAAWEALYGVRLTVPLTEEGRKRLAAARVAVRTREGLGYDAYVLDRAGIGTEAANRVAMGPGVMPPRFRWVPYDDALLFPLDNSGLAAGSPDRARFFPLEDKVRARYLAAVGRDRVPGTLREYMDEVLLPTLRAQKAGGAIAVKFELAYLRPLDIGAAREDEAAAVYAASVHGGVPDPERYKVLEDFLFRAIAKECGRLGMAVHFHAMAGAGSYFSIAGVNPLNLEPVFNDPALRGTRFVLLHGGYPFVHETGALLQKPNVYLDVSQQAILVPARTLATWLREWLELYPEKVLFGTDGYPYTAEMGWEESTWLAARNARAALGLALTGMLRDGEISPERADAMARMVLRENAEALYGTRF